jgi:poly(A) polymerase
MNKQATIIPRSEHCISRKDIDPNALKVLYRLQECGFDAFLVGGCVRDLLAGQHPKDFDIATNAHPEEVRKAFRNCRLIGKRFRLAHILFGYREFLEVATFRAAHDSAPQQDGHTKDGRIMRDNVYGTIEEDALRRDFTVNALYYNIKDHSVWDFTNGVNDLENKTLRIIGDAKTRYEEDPVRMIRAVRIAAKLDLVLEEDTAKQIKPHLNLLKDISSSRLFDEVLKLFHTKHASTAYPALLDSGLFNILFPETARCLKQDKSGKLNKMFKTAFKQTDGRLKAGKTVSPAFLFALLLWPVAEKQCAEYAEQENLSPMMAMFHVANVVLKQQCQMTMIPKRLCSAIKDIWFLQLRLLTNKPRQAERCLRSRRFRAGYDLLLLRVNLDEALQARADWWTHIQTIEDEEEKLAHLENIKTL